MLRAKPKELRWATLPKNTLLSRRAYKLKTRMRVTGSRVKQNNWEGVTRTDPLSFGPKFPEILVEWIAPFVSVELEKNQSIFGISHTMSRH